MSPFLMEVPAKGAPRSFSVERHTTYLVPAYWLFVMLMSRELSASLRQIVPRLWIVLNRVFGHHPTAHAHLDLEAASRVAEDVDFRIARGGDVGDEDTAEL